MQTENCPRCKHKFTCNAKDITNCDCTKIKISREEQTYISSKFSGCICNACLSTLKQEYILTTQLK